MFRTRRAWVPGVVALAIAVALALTVTGAGRAKSGRGKDQARKEVAPEEAKGYLGVYMQKLTQDLRDGLDLKTERGVLVNDVAEDSPADEAGIEEGDVILSFNGKDVDSPDALADMVAQSKVGQEVDIVLFRDGKTKTVKLVVGEQPDDFGWFTVGDLGFDRDDIHHLHTYLSDWIGGPRLGVEVAELNDDLAPYFKTGAKDGVLVLEVNEDSAAEKAGIKAGDVIETVGGEKVTSADELRAALRDREEGDTVDVVVVRKGKKQTLTATMEEPKELSLWRSKSLPHVYRFDSGVPQHGRRMMMIDPDDRADAQALKDEMKELKKELDEMKEELRKLKKD